MNRQFLLCMSRVGTCMGTMAFAGALPVLRSAWHMDAATAGSIQTAFNLSNAFALLVTAWLSDGLGARRVYLACTWAGAAALVIFAIFARTPHSALLLIVLVGLTQGGAYAPALLLVADLSSPADRGRAMGQILAAASLGYLLSVFFSMWAASAYGPAAGFTMCATGASAGAVLGQIGLKGVENRRHGHETAARSEPMEWRRVFGPASLCLLVGYVAHCWELLGSWAWTPTLLATALQPSKLGAMTTSLIVSVTIHLSGMIATGVVGALSDRLGRARVLICVGAIGAICSMLIGWSQQWGPGWVIALAAIGSFFILADSGVLSAAMTDEVPAAYLGRVMGIRSILGFGAGAFAPMTFGATLDWTHRWGWAYMPLAAGGIVAALAAWALRKIGQPVGTGSDRRQSAVS
ncbi:MFS transporter [Burkholderia sp. Bp9143]|uniref:MFS transporter n=1 Tax=Burkholderia sp. Bp9143 TaxID=2184574 RepID=UPI000F599D5D|nr:MFS transporter [Burkholderia sp. Bp9143]RQR35454.1 MFS transporter [Burkholderia sp. Bp9143]